MLNDIIFTYYDETNVTTDLIQDVFTKLNTQVTGQNWVKTGQADAYYLKDIFFYHNDQVPGANPYDPPLQLSLESEEDPFSDRTNNVFSGPNGIIGEILGSRAFKHLDVAMTVRDALRSLFPTEIVGAAGTWVYFNGLPLNFDVWFEKGIISIRIATFPLPENSSVTYREVAEAIWYSLINNLEYVDS